jgi:predicted Zn-dependent protease
MTLVRGDIYTKKQRHLALLEAHSLRQDQLIDYAVVIVDLKVKRAEVLTNVIAHEIGHSLGLLDCTKCSSGSTVMGYMKGADESEWN